MQHFVRDSTANYGKVKMVLQHNKFYVESAYPKILRELLRDPKIQSARIGAPSKGSAGFRVTEAPQDTVAQTLIVTDEGEGKELVVAPQAEDQIHSFEIDPLQVRLFYE